MAKRRNHNGAVENHSAKLSEPAAHFLSLTLRNIRCFGDEPQTLNLSDEKGQPARWTVLLGNNGSGKTTILQTLAFFDDPTDELSDFPPGIVPAFLRNGANEGRSAAKVVLGSPFDVLDDYSKTVELSYLATPTGYRTDGKPSCPVPLRRYGYGASRRIGFGPLPEPETETGCETLFSHYSNLRNGEEWLLRTDHAVLKYKHKGQERALQHVKKLLLAVLPDDVTDVLFNPGEGVYPKPHVDFKTPDGWVPLRQLGYGYQTLIAWMVDFASRMVERYPDSRDPLAEPAVVLVDEIDLHLHPTWQRKLIGHLTERFVNTQFIVTAHSPLIVQAAAEDANIALLRREGDHVVIDNDVGHIRGWSIDMLLTSNLFGLPSSRPPQYDAVFERRKTLLGKSKHTAKEKEELAALNEKVYQLPYGETAEQAKTSLLIQESLELLKKNLPQPQ